MDPSEMKPSPYQLAVLRAGGCRVRPRSYESARQRIHTLPPSDNQVALLTELGLPLPATRQAASEALGAYERAHPEWAAARRAARSAKGIATRRQREAAGQQPRYDPALLCYAERAAERFGGQGASAPALSFLRGLALKLPADDPRRKETFDAMDQGLSALEASRRIDMLNAGRRG